MCVTKKGERLDVAVNTHHLSVQKTDEITGAKNQFVLCLCNVD